MVWKSPLSIYAAPSVALESASRLARYARETIAVIDFRRCITCERRWASSRDFCKKKPAAEVEFEGMDGEVSGGKRLISCNWLSKEIAEQGW